MTRTKPAPALVIADLTAADEVLRELCEIKRSRTAIGSALNEIMDKAKAEAAAKDAPHAARQTILEAALKQFATFNKDTLFKEKKTIPVVFGSLSFRKSTKVKALAGWTWDMVLQKMADLGFKTGIREKKEVDKEELRTWSDEQLAQIGVKKDPKDEFGYELNEEALIEKNSAA